MTYPIVDMESVSIIFGNAPEQALPMMDAGDSREKIQSETGQILGVHDCSLQVEEGEIVVLMGLSGSGKSTLLRAVNGLNKVARGAVRVDDGKKPVDITCANAETLRFFRTTRISMVFQQFGLLPWRTVADNVAFGLEIAGVDIEKRRKSVEEQLEMVNLQEWGDRKVQELSGGMQQRVGLARAFATESPILLMDEPFSALDPLIRLRLQDELLDLQKRLQRTILFVSHDLDEALKLGNRIVIMEGGRIVQTGRPEDIVLHPATEYVADFVAHMNPLKTLRAASVMRPLTSVPADYATGDYVIANIDAPLLDVLRAKHESGKPVYIVEDDKWVGVIDNNEIYNALLRT
ncbi:MAG: choline ABC transporter ATP-binding protein [Gammaproteobacteria bacterium WSBS_2016_MAG_OTU1]